MPHRGREIVKPITANEVLNDLTDSNSTAATFIFAITFIWTDLNNSFTVASRDELRLKG